MSARAPLLALDFIPRPWRVGASGWLVLVLGIAGACVVVSDYRKTDAALSAAQASHVRLSRRADQSRLKALAAQRETVPEAELRRANGVALALARPWGGLFKALDAVADPQVVMTRMEPSGPKGTVSISGEARSLQELFDYARRLGAQPGIREAHVDTYSFREVGAARSVSFSLTARWGSGS